MIPPALTALTSYPQFIVYKIVPSESRPGKFDKFPCDFQTGKTASALDAANWTDFDTASNCAESLRLQTQGNYRVGFVLTKNDPFFCLDIDNCLQPDGQESPIADELCKLFSGAAIEVSQSTRGRHIWGKYSGPEPAHGCKDISLGLELYTSGRFIALGDPASAAGDAATDCTLQLECVITLYFPPAAPAQAIAQEWTEGPSEDWRGPDDDSELVRRAMLSHSSSAAFGHRASFADLWNAIPEALSKAYPAEGRPYDASSADAALAQHLAFWTGKDCARLRRLMEQSKLTRDKWQREDYLRRTILNAVARQVEVLQDRQNVDDAARRREQIEESMRIGDGAD